MQSDRCYVCGERPHVGFRWVRKKQPTDVVVGCLALPSDPSNVILVCHVEGVLVVRNKQPTPRRPAIGDARSTQCYSRGHRGDMKKHINVSAVFSHSPEWILFCKKMCSCHVSSPGRSSSESQRIFFWDLDDHVMSVAQDLSSSCALRVCCIGDHGASPHPRRAGPRQNAAVSL